MLEQIIQVLMNIVIGLTLLATIIIFGSFAINEMILMTKEILGMRKQEKEIKEKIEL